MGIEVDDLSHLKEKNRKRDAFVNELFARMKLPLLRYKAKMKYTAEDVRTEIKATMREN